MAAEIQVAFKTGQSLYAIIRNAAGQVYNSATPGFENYNAADYASYSTTTLVEQGATAWYGGDFPSLAAGKYSLDIRQRAGGSPAVTDTEISAGGLYWTGTAEVVQSGDAFARLGTPAGASIAADIGTRAAPGAAMTLTPGERDAIANDFLDLANSIESGETLRQTLRLIRAVLYGVATENAGTYTLKRKDGSTVALTVVHDTIGNRSSVTVGTV